MKNWDSMKERWALSWGHINEILKPDMALDECVDTLMFLQAIAEMEYAKKITDVGHMRYESADQELKKLAREVSPHTYRLVEEQYWISKDRKTHYEMEEIHSRLFVLKGGSDTSASYHVDTTRYHCSCVFMKTMLLPCRHTVIPIRYLAPRWKLSYKLNQPAAEEDASDKAVACTTFQVRDSAMTARRQQVLNGSTKYKHAFECGKSIADIMSRNVTFVFKDDDERIGEI
ncbi:hypothetical protein JG688_00016317 [Phytophthora aleatoria]|uniref:SWIM-type domain-containing protein n=1 Tax=Phytophthora aleatoria TaxID=2496075 RepID=A0A8J5LWA6_9STRA|nr:hypothetical protein JG688_00016317 [Phytophthora aleatoria]